MRNNWTNEELILALYWYCTKIPFTKIRYTKPEVIELATLIGRTPSAAALKLVNLARLDPSLQRRGVKGMGSGSKAELPVWEEFYGNWAKLAIVAEEIIAQKRKTAIELSSGIEIADLPKAGKERETIVKVRINQSFFRRSVLLSYSNQCCITGIKIPELLIASHIKPWSHDLNEAASPENGLCLNALHDRAFDRGLITLTDGLKIVVSQSLLERKKDESVLKYFTPYHGKEIIRPKRFYPKVEFLDYHRKQIFIE